ncbi:FRG domain-containing protein [Thalassospira lucentensis]|uniref:FRG domain-containing protein n=1 Tax=Thalassospira lucentensis TaxID=168935 RepID=UPI003D279B37
MLGQLSPDPSSPELWYRGHSKDSYLLQPFTHRGLEAQDRASVELAERLVFAEFDRRSPLYDSYRRDRWDLLFLMQHYRAPTRLLDWTSSPLVALFFALMEGDTEEDAVVWCIDPSAWNGIVLGDISETPRILTTDERLVEQYHPCFDDKSNRSEPIAIQGIMNNPRINAQKGRFVIFSSDPKPLETFAENNKVKFNGPTLTKIVIDKDAKEAVLIDLECYGITYSTVFPDLEGLAVEIRRQFGVARV